MKYLIKYRFLLSDTISKSKYNDMFNYMFNQPAITCSKLTIKTLEQGMKYVQS